MSQRRLLLLALCVLPGATAFAASSHRHRLVPARICIGMQCWRAAPSQMQQEEADPLASAFAKEAAKRAQQSSSAAQPSGGMPSPNEPFSGIKEIVLDQNGSPMAIPRRPAPPPASTQADEVKDLLQSPSFLFGSLVSIASLVLLLAIAQADANASL